MSVQPTVPYLRCADIFSFLPMRKLLLLLFFLGTISASAQFTEDGFYRVRNVASKRYIFVEDNSGSVHYEAGTAEMGAVCLHRDPERMISDPAAVIYIKQYSDKEFDLMSQGTGVHSLINYYVQVYGASDGTYKVYAKGQYLCDSDQSTREDGMLDTRSTGYNKDNFKWEIYSITDPDHYFGIAPSIMVGEKFFKPFYADFGFSFANNGMKAWTVSEIREDAVIVAELNSEIIADNTPVIIECSSNITSDNKLNLYKSQVQAPDHNLLKGVYFNNELRSKKGSKDAKTPFDPATMRVLGVMSDGRLGYVLSDQPNLAANESYLVVPEGTPEELPVMTAEEYEAGVYEISLSEENVIYDLAGRRLEKIVRPGIYIVNHRKVLYR